MLSHAGAGSAAAGLSELERRARLRVWESYGRGVASTLLCDPPWKERPKRPPRSAPTRLAGASVRHAGWWAG